MLNKLQIKAPLPVLFPFLIIGMGFFWSVSYGSGPDWYPIYHFTKTYTSITIDDFYTMDSSEGTGYSYLGIPFYFSKSSSDNSTPVHRLIYTFGNKTIHFFTPSWDEWVNFDEPLGWKYEKIMGYVYMSSLPSNQFPNGVVDINRFNQQYLFGSRHIYAVSGSSESNSLLNDPLWRLEANYPFKTSPDGKLPCPQLTTPQNNATITSSPVTLHWNTISNVNSYIVQVSPTISFNQSVLSIQVWGVTSAVFNLSNGTWYWRVKTISNYQAQLNNGASGDFSSYYAFYLNTSGSGPRITFTPNPLDFGTVNVNSSATATFQIYNYALDGVSKLTINSITGNPQFAVLNSPATPFSISPSLYQILTVKFTPTSSVTYNGNITIGSNDPSASIAYEGVTGIGSSVSSSQPQISTNPSGLYFGTVTVGNNLQLSLTINNTGNTALTIGSTNMNNTDYQITSSVPGSIGANSSQAITIRFTPSIAGNDNGTLTINSNDPNTPALQVTLTGSGTNPSQPSAQIITASYPFDFGSQNVGSTISESFSIKNVGNAVLNVTSLQVSGAGFSLSVGIPTNFSVSAGNSSTITINFSPTATNTYSGNVLFATNDPINPSMGLALHGSGTIPRDTLNGSSPAYCPFNGEPVNSATGNYVNTHTDFRIPTRAGSLNLVRSYNAQINYLGTFGYNWRHTYDIRLSEDTSGIVKIMWADGRAEYYGPLGGGSYQNLYSPYSGSLIKNLDNTYRFKTKDRTAYLFSTFGSLSTITDKNGNIVFINYNGFNQLISVSDPVGRTINFYYNTIGQITTVIDFGNRIYQYTYDANTNLVTYTSPRGSMYTYSYDTLHRIIQIMDPRGNPLVTNDYDAMSRVTTQTGAKGYSMNFTYDTVNFQTLMMDALGQFETNIFDPGYEIIQDIDARGYSNQYTYDSAHNRTSLTDKNLNTNIFSSDSHGNQIMVVDPSSDTTQMFYDQYDQIISRIDRIGQMTSYSYDSLGNLITVISPLGFITNMAYDQYGELTELTDSLGNSTHYLYDIYGNLKSRIDAQGNQTHFNYDSFDRVTSMINPRNGITLYQYDNDNNLVKLTDPIGAITQYGYDSNNNRIQLINPMGSTTLFVYDNQDLLQSVTDALGHTITYSYDSLNRFIQTTDARGNVTLYYYDPIGNLVTAIDALGNQSQYQYDGNANRILTQNPNSHQSFYSFDILNRLIGFSDPLGNVTFNFLDPVDRLTSMRDGNNLYTQFTYDNQGRLVKVQDGANNTAHYSYDSVGNCTNIVDPNNHQTGYVFDSLNRLVSETDAQGHTISYTYDSLGNLSTRTDGNGAIRIYFYDLNNRLNIIIYQDGNQVNFSYDSAGNRTTMTDSNGTTNYQYDLLSRLTSVTDSYGQTVGYGYDSYGNRTSLIYPGGKIVTYTFDSLNRLNTVVDWLGGIFQYNYDSAGNLTMVLNPNGTWEQRLYDTADRLTTIVTYKSDTSVIASYGFVLDNVGNRRAINKTDSIPRYFDAINVTYGYDSANQILISNSSTFTGTTTVTTFSFDSNGNEVLQTQSGVSTNYIYDFADRLIQASNPSQNSQYGYNGRGDRIISAYNGQTTEYLLDQNVPLTNVLAEMDNSGNIMAYYIYGRGLVEKINASDTSQYVYHLDGIGSVVAITDSTQNIANSYAYDEFGGVANQLENISNPFKYVGRYGVMQDLNGLLFMRARYFDPSSGRFVNRDSQVGDLLVIQQLNRYVYVVNNPLIYMDVSGLSLSSWWSNSNINPANWLPVPEYGSTQYNLYVIGENGAQTIASASEVVGSTLEASIDLSHGDIRGAGNSLIDVVSNLDKAIGSASQLGANASKLLNGQQLDESDPKGPIRQLIYSKLGNDTGNLIDSLLEAHSIIGGLTGLIDNQNTNYILDALSLPFDIKNYIEETLQNYYITPPKK